MKLLNKRTTCLMLALCLILIFTGCTGTDNISPSTPTSKTLESTTTVTGIVTAVNGNEVTLELVKMGGMSDRGGAPQGDTSAPEGGFSGNGGQAPPEMPADGQSPSDRQPPSGGGQGSGKKSGSRPDGAGKQSDTSSQGSWGSAPDGNGMPPEGDMPFIDGTTGGQNSYTRTGETATYQVPVGAPVTNMAGATKDFNALAVDTLITITLTELGDGTQKVQSVQILMSV